MSFTHSITFACAASLLVGGVLPCAGQTMLDLQKQVKQLKKENALLERQKQSLQVSLADANRAESENAQALARIKTRLNALGRSVFSTKDETIIESVTSVDRLNERLETVESSAHTLVASIQTYLGTAVASDPELRLQVEESIRKLDSALGLRQKPRPNVATGSLKNASVVSKDSESGMLVFNVGRDSGARIGMTFLIRRGDQTLGEATIVDVRSRISGAFVDSLLDPQLTVSPGDAVSLKTVQQ